MRSIFSRGQLEVSFQWVFVLIAGALFLLMFFSLIRGCTQSGDSRIQGISIQSAATRLETAAWQKDSFANITVHPALVSCPAGVLTLSTAEATASIERTAVFLPPELSGKLNIISKEVLISERESSPIRLGNVLYAIDANTYYIIITDSSGTNKPFYEEIKNHPNVLFISYDEKIDKIPASAKTVIIASHAARGYVENANLSYLSQEIKVLGVFIKEDTKEVYFFRSGEYIDSLKYGADQIAQGAIVSGELRNFACSRANFVDRMKFMTSVYAERAFYLVDEMFFSSCINTMNESAIILQGINNGSRGDYLTAVFDASSQLAARQNALTYNSCPVIA